MPDVIDDIIRREGAFVNHPDDRGGATKYGITILTLSQWRGRPCTVDDVATLTIPEARAIYSDRYIDRPGFGQLAPSPLRDQLIDYGVNSGPPIAITKLQAILGVEIDGVFGPQTFAAVKAREMRELNNLLLAARIKMFANLAVTRPSQLSFLRGWVARALEFLLP